MVPQDLIYFICYLVAKQEWGVECWQSPAWSIWLPFLHPPDCLRIGLGPGALSYQEIRVLTALAGFITLWGNTFPISDSIFVILFCLSLWSYDIWPTPLTNLSPRKAALSWLLGGTVGHGGLTHTTEADLALSLLYVSKALFHPVLHCVVFSLAVLMSRFESVGISTSGDRQQMSFT